MSNELIDGDVELKQQTGLNLITKQIQSFRQYVVKYCGKNVGLIGWGSNDKLIFTGLVGPVEERVICQAVTRILGRDVSSVVPDDISPEDIRGDYDPSIDDMEDLG